MALENEKQGEFGVRPRAWFIVWDPGEVRLESWRLERREARSSLEKGSELEGLHSLVRTSL